MTFRKFSKRQKLALSWWNQPGSREMDGILCDGAVRSGKTMALTCGFFLWSMTRFRGQVFALCGKTVSALRRNLILPLGDWLGGMMQISENRAENKLTVRLGDRVNTYYLFGGQDESSYMLIQGITLAGVLLDEVVLMPRSFVEQAAARCSVEGAKLWFSCNPGSPEHWFYREWVCKAPEKRLLRLHFTMEDNPALPETVKARYRRLYTGVFYQRYVLGRWCAAEGRIYDFDRQRHTVETSEVVGAQYYISVDYGVHNPFSAGLWAVDKGVAVRIREFYHSGRESGKLMTDEEYLEALVALAGELPIRWVVVDPSAAGFLALLRKRKVFRVRRADNRVLPGIRLVGSLLEQNRLRIGRNCPNAIREFGLYVWQDDNARDVPVKENDHAMDEIRYFCMSVMRK